MDIDTENTDPKYWDKILKDLGLSMSAGRHYRIRYSRDIEALERKLTENKVPRSGRAVKPKGRPPQD